MFPNHPALSGRANGKLEHVVEADVPAPTVALERTGDGLCAGPRSVGALTREARLAALGQSGKAEAQAEVHRGTIEEREVDRVDGRLHVGVRGAVLVLERRGL